MSLVIRADASVRAGTGHVMRCLALAQTWRTAIGPVCFVTSNGDASLAHRLEREQMTVAAAAGPPGHLGGLLGVSAAARRTGARWVVVDGYHFAPTYRAALQGAGFRVLMIDDNGEHGPYHDDIVLNQNAHAHAGLYVDHGPSTRLLLGTEYVLLRSEFLRPAPSSPLVPFAARRLLITMGGADAGNATLTVMEALARLPGEGLECDAILGAANPHRASLEAASRARRLPVRLLRDPSDLAERMARAEAAISAGGATLWELCYSGVPTLAVALADNQRPVVAHLRAAGALVDGTTAWKESAAALAGAIGGLLADEELRTRLRRVARQLVDGRGAARVVAALRRHEEASA
jgi:UDP-2,4-diacetamido-2,4,6-trideoxy-beta-L-altropyranose hydrolase